MERLAQKGSLIKRGKGKLKGNFAPSPWKNWPWELETGILNKEGSLPLGIKKGNN